jgi:hypothetical protein
MSIYIFTFYDFYAALHNNAYLCTRKSLAGTLHEISHLSMISFLQTQIQLSTQILSAWCNLNHCIFSVNKPGKFSRPNRSFSMWD